ncbi:UNVERIFIED_CONTAM: hypothetical protein PYX00_010964 [Menopon gallinae]|uniref:Core domain-containing protein n=1 Tax=Menopon gallinae TaxID=328185 RepID=A0AAW2H6Z0_9NEOP
MRITQSNLLLSIDATTRLKEILANKPSNTFLRVEVLPGGCQGFNIKFSLDSNIKSDDKIFKQDDVNLVCDETSLQIIDGSTIEYSSNLMGKYFWLNVKNAKNKCSCGSSFSF